MAATHSLETRQSHQETASVLRFALAGAATTALLFVSCWIGVLIAPTLLSHMFIELFTAAPTSSVNALWQGLCSSLFFGGVTGLLAAWLYNAFAFVDRK